MVADAAENPGLGRPLAPAVDCPIKSIDGTEKHTGCLVWPTGKPGQATARSAQKVSTHGRNSTSQVHALRCCRWIFR